MTKLSDAIYDDIYGEIEIWSQDEMEYFFQDKECDCEEY